MPGPMDPFFVVKNFFDLSGEDSFGGAGSFACMY